MDEALVEKFVKAAGGQNAEVLLIGRGELASALREIARGAGASSYSASDELKGIAEGPLKEAGLREVELSADIALTGASCAVASTGSLVIEGARRKFITSEVHVAVVEASKIVPDLDGLHAGGKLRPPFTIVTGPSRTADIERVLVLGAHGPRRLVVLMLKP